MDDSVNNIHLRYRVERLEEELKTSVEKVRIAKKALKDIASWDDDLEEEWEDPGYRAIEALKTIKSIK